MTGALALAWSEFPAATRGPIALDGVGSLSGRSGVCRDYAHLAVAFCRALNIPARYCTGYLGDVGTPPPYSPGDFAAWFEAYLGGQWLRSMRATVREWIDTKTVMKRHSGTARK